MTYDYITEHSSPNHSGKRSLKVKTITIHHWGVTGQKFDNVVRYLCRSKGSSSAHYVAEANKVACIVDPDNIAWHAGVWAANQTSIGIECRPEATDEDYRTVAELIADLRKVYGNVPLKRHRDWKATACPGKWDIARLDRMADEIAKDGKADTKPVSKPQPAPKPKPEPERPNVRELQEAVRTKADNVWGPNTDKALKAVRAASVWGGSKFPHTVRFAQKVVGTKVDGAWGENSGRAHDSTVKAIQKALRGMGFNPGAVDGIWGDRTEAAFQKARKAAFNQ